MVTSAFTMYMMPGCNFSLDDPMLQTLLNSSEASGDFSFDFDFETGGSGDGLDDGTDDGSNGGLSDEPDDNTGTE